MGTHTWSIDSSRQRETRAFLDGSIYIYARGCTLDLSFL